jgi:hypothetical protein
VPRAASWAGLALTLIVAIPAAAAQVPPKPQKPPKPNFPTNPSTPPGVGPRAERRDERLYPVDRAPTSPRVVVDSSLAFGVLVDGGFRHAAVQAGARVYVVSATGVARALALTDGQEAWKTQLAAGSAARPVVAGDRLYVALQNGDLAALETEFGGLKNTQRIGAANGNLVAGGGTVVAPLADGSLVLLDAATLAVRARVAGVPGLNLSTPLIHGNLVLTADGRGHVRAVDLATGALRYDRDARLLPGVEPRLLPSGIALFAGRDDSVVGIDPTSGQEAFRRVGFAKVVGIGVHPGGALLAFENARLFELDAAGTPTRDIRLPGPPIGAPRVAPGGFAVPLGGGTLARLDRSLRITSKLELRSPLLETGTVDREPLLLSVADGIVYRLADR